MNGVTGDALELSGVNNVVFSGAILNAISYAGAACNFFNCLTVVFSGNLLGRQPATTGDALPAQALYMLGLSGNTDYVVSTGNVGFNGASNWLHEQYCARYPQSYVE